MEIVSPICLRHGHRHVHRNVRISLSTTTPTLLSTKSENSMFILGLGFVGQTLARKLQNQRWTVSGTCTTHVKKKKLEDMGFHVHLFDANHPDPSILQQLRNYTHFLVSVPPVVGIGDPMLQHEELIRSSLVNGDLKWLSYLSSTSVYGDCDGELVDEDYPTNQKMSQLN